MPSFFYLFFLFLNVFLIISLGNEKIDMSRMKNILERNILEYLSNLESNPHDAVAFLAIGDILYGSTPEDVINVLISCGLIKKNLLFFSLKCD